MSLTPEERRWLIESVFVAAQQVELEREALVELLARTLAGIEVALVEPERCRGILESLHDEIAVKL